MHWTRAELTLHHGQIGEFKRLCAKYFDGISNIGWHLQGAWESVIGHRSLIVDVWGFQNPEAATTAIATFMQEPRYQPFFQQALPTIFEEDFKRIELMPYCREFRTLKARALLYWTMQSRRDSFAEWATLRSRFIPMAEERGWQLAAAWSFGLGAGNLSECTEVWAFEDDRTVLPLVARVEGDEKVQQVLAPAEALLVKDSRQLLRPTWYSPDYLA